MISEREVLIIHSILIERFGGANGIRDKELLDSALNRQYQTFDGKELYPTPLDKAAAILESIVKKPPVYRRQQTNRLRARQTAPYERPT